METSQVPGSLDREYAMDTQGSKRLRYKALLVITFMLNRCEMNLLELDRPWSIAIDVSNVVHGNENRLMSRYQLRALESVLYDSTYHGGNLVGWSNMKQRKIKCP